MFDTSPHDSWLASALDRIRSLVAPEAEAAVRTADTLTEAAKGASAQLVSEVDCIATAARQLLAMCATPQARGKTGGDMTAVAARLRHDLRTPLVAIKGFGELVLEAAEDDELADVAASAHHLLDCVSHILNAIERALPAE